MFILDYGNDVRQKPKLSDFLLISWLQSLSEVILDPKKIKSVTVPFSPPSICHEVVGPDAMIFTFSMLSFKQLFLSLIYLF